MSKRPGPGGSGRSYMPPHNRVMASPDTMKKIKSLVCLNLPTQFLDRVNFKRHFSKFGRVLKISIAAAKNSGTVYFDSHESAANAKQNGAKGMPENFQIYWSQTTRKSLDSDSPPKKSFPSSEVQDELQSMAQGSGYNVIGNRDSRDQGEPLRQNRLDMFRNSPERPERQGNFAPRGNNALRPSNPFGKPNTFAPRPTGPPPNFFNQAQATHDKPPALFPAFDRARFSFVAPKKDAPRFPDADKPKPQPSFPSLETSNRPAVQPPRQPIFGGQENTLAAPEPPAPTTTSVSALAPAFKPSFKPLPQNPQTAAWQATIRKKAQSNEDILAILEARDKLLRQKMTRSSSLATAVKTVPQCQDMCPEKERYLRQERHQVTQYEMREGVVDHRLFIKEYSRSSADQELPLPSELRPSSVLRRTMNYLLFSITPRVDFQGEHLGDWFLFMWDRTRAIRKEVTQQELCNEDAVILLEQCTRFHIACAARLAEEDVHDFDSKINSENLAKCLQTLKHLYHDMSLMGKACPNEPEFQAYIVLLNLNTGDAIWEVQQLSSQIYDSIPVQLAIKVYLALSTHNYVNFFKMVRAIGYMPGAILMRYFTQARTKALEVLIRSHCPTAKASYTFPLADLMRILGFEGTEDTIEFCQYHGLDTTADTVSLSKTTFMMPESAVPMNRAKNLVESQLRTSFAEVIAGYPAQMHFAEPQAATSSFDQSTGMLTAEVMRELEDRGNAGVAAAPPASTNIALSKNIFSSQSLFTKPVQAPSIFSQALSAAAKPTPQALFGQVAQQSGPPKSLFASHASQPAMDPQKANKIALAALQSITDSVVPHMVKEVATVVSKDYKLAKMSQTIAKNIYPKAITEFLRETVAQELAVVKQEEQARKAALLEKERKELQRQELIKKKSVQTTDQIIKEVTAREVMRICSAELEKQKRMNELSKLTAMKLLKEVVEQSVAQEAENELRMAKEIWRKKVQALCDKLLKCRARRMLLKWRDLVYMLKERRERLQRFPAGRSSLSTSDQINALCVVSPEHKDSYSTGKKIKPMTSIRTIGTQCLPLVAVEQVSSLLQKPCRMPPFLLGDYKVTPPVWRFLCSVPENNPRLKNWAEICLAREKLSPIGGSTTFFCNGVIMRFELTVGLASTNSKPHAVALIVTDQREAANRLEQLLLDPPPVPVALLLIRANKVEDELKSAMHRLSSAKALTTVKSFAVTEDELYSASKFQDALEWLAFASKHLMDFYVVTPVKDVVTSFMQSTLWQTVVMSTGPKTSEQLQDLQKNPSLCLKIVNGALEQLGSMVWKPAPNLLPEEESLFKICCPDLPPYWNHTAYRQEMGQIINSLQLPQCNLDSQTLQQSTWPEILKTLSDFCSQLPMEPEKSSLLFNWVSHQILSFSRRQSLTPITLPWANILESVLREFVSSQRIEDPLSISNADLYVTLSCKQLDLFTACKWCNPDLLRAIERVFPGDETDESDAETDVHQPGDKGSSALLSIHDKLQALLLGLEESKAKRIKIEEKVTSNYAE